IILEGLPRHASTHAAGIILTGDPLVNHVPVMDTTEDVKLTQYAMDDLENLGLLKIDLLGLKNLSLIEHILESIKQTANKQIDLKPNELTDIIALNALYRPGPMDQIPTFINRKNNKAPVTYIHEDLKPILKDTYGVLVYQEQIMKIAHEIAGFSLGEADLLRRAVSKKDADVMANLKKEFLKGCLENGYKKAVGEEIFSWIDRFANYGFNKSH